MNELTTKQFIINYQNFNLLMLEKAVMLCIYELNIYLEHPFQAFFLVMLKRKIIAIRYVLQNEFFGVEDKIHELRLMIEVLLGLIEV